MKVGVYVRQTDLAQIFVDVLRLSRPDAVEEVTAIFVRRLGLRLAVTDCRDVLCLGALQDGRHVHIREGEVQVVGLE